MFRVGISDEEFVQRGITHLLEHLVLSVDQATNVEWNGFVDLTRTVFHARGARDDVAAWLESVARRIADPSLVRLEHERKVLRAESLRTPSTAFEAGLRLRYGFDGPGLLEVQELGLRHVGPDELLAWRDRYFTAENSIIWSTALLEGLDLRLPAGARRAPKVPEVVAERLPAVAEAAFPGLLLTSTVNRQTVMPALLRHLQRRSQGALRHDQGVAYSVGASYVPFTADLAFASLSTDAADENLEAAELALVAACRDVANHGVSSDELDQDLAATTRVMNDPLSLNVRLDAAALAVLLDDEIIGDRELLERTAALRSDDIAEAAGEWLGAALLLTPTALSMPEGFGPYGQPPALPVIGEKIRPTYRPWFDDAVLLQLSDRGLMYSAAGQPPVVIRFDTCVGALAWDDGSRALADRRGAWLTIDVNEWRKAARITGLVDRCAPRPIVPMGAPPAPAADWRKQRRRALIRNYLSWLRRTLGPVGLVMVILLAAGAVGMFAVVLVNTFGIWGLWLLLGLALARPWLRVAAFRIRRRWRQRGGR
jgi:zinc protease